MTFNKKNRVFSLPKDSYFLFGLRGTGKSTWIKEHYSNCFYIDLLMYDELRSYSSYPERLKSIIYAQKDIKTVVVDEIQKIPELLPVIHSIIEERKEIQFILTGSNAQTSVDLLAGRAIKRMMHPFLASEMGNNFSLDASLKLGMLPVVWGAQEPEEVLDSYVDLYIQEEGLARNIGSFTRFLSVIAFSHGCRLNLNNIARESEVKRHQISYYLEIIQDLLLAYLVPVFTSRAQRNVVSHPKFYLFDAGVYRSLRKLGRMDAKEEVDGIALEGLVFQHLMAWCDYSKGKYQISYWRTKAGLEVDFIIYGEGVFLAIEVKNNKKVFSHDVRGLLHFRAPQLPSAYPYREITQII